MKRVLISIIILCFLTLTTVSCGNKFPYMIPAEVNGPFYLHDPFVRNNYFYGKLLSTQDFEEEQSYFRGKNQLINRLIYGSGVVCGLWVMVNPEKPWTVMVSPGLAIDAQGLEVLVSQSQVISLNGYSGDVYLTVRYKETLIDPIPIPGQDQKMEYDKVREDSEFAVLTALSEDYVSTYKLLNKSDSKNLIQQIFQNHSACYTIEKEIPIVLAKIHIRKSGKFEDDDIDNIHFRRLILNSSDILLLLASRLKD